MTKNKDTSTAKPVTKEAAKGSEAGEDVANASSVNLRQEGCAAEQDADSKTDDKIVVDRNSTTSNSSSTNASDNGSKQTASSAKIAVVQVHIE